LESPIFKMVDQNLPSEFSRKIMVKLEPDLKL